MMSNKIKASIQKDKQHKLSCIDHKPKFIKLIAALRTCISDDLGKMNKDGNSYDDIMDTFRLALKGINLVKKETQKQTGKS